MALPEEEPARFEPESFLPLLPEPLDLIDGVADCIRLRPGRRLTDCLGLGLCVQAQRRLETNKKGHRTSGSRRLRRGGQGLM